jgi:hypothetical protein
MGITLTAYGIAGRIHFLAERIGDGIRTDSVKAIKLACHLGEM